MDAQTDNPPPLVPLSWVWYLALAVAGAEGLRVPFGCIVPYSGGGGGGVLEKSKTLWPRESGRRVGGRPTAPAGCLKGCGWPNGCQGERGIRGLRTSSQRRAWRRRGSWRWDEGPRYGPMCSP